MNQKINYNPQDICSLLLTYWTLRFQMHVREPINVLSGYIVRKSGYVERPVGLTLITDAADWRTAFSDVGAMNPTMYAFMTAIAVIPGSDGSVLTVELFDSGCSDSKMITLQPQGDRPENNRLYKDGEHTTWGELDLQLYGPWLTREITRLLELRSSQHQAFQKAGGMQGKSESLRLSRLIHDYVLLRQSLEPRFEIPKIRTVEVNILDPGLFRYGDPVESGFEVERETLRHSNERSPTVEIDVDTSKRDQLVYQIPQHSNWHDAAENEEPIVLTVFVSGEIDGRVCELSTLCLEGGNRNNARLYLGETPVQWSELGSLAGFIKSVEGDLEHWQAIADANKTEVLPALSSVQVNDQVLGRAQRSGPVADRLRKLADLIEQTPLPAEMLSLIEQHTSTNELLIKMYTTLKGDK